MMKYIFFLVIITAASGVKGQTVPSAVPHRVGYANVEYIISQLPEIKEIQTDLQSTQTQLRNQIQARSAEVEKQYNDFNSNMESMHDTVRVNRQRELEQAVAGLEEMQQNAQQTLQNKQKLYMAPLYLKVNRMIQDVAQQNGFTVVLTENIGEYNLLLYKDKGRDISDLVLKAMGVTPEPKKE